MTPGGTRISAPSHRTRSPAQHRRVDLRRDRRHAHRRTSVCTGVDAEGSAQKLVYFTLHVFRGFPAGRFRHAERKCRRIERSQGGAACSACRANADEVLAVFQIFEGPCRLPSYHNGDGWRAALGWRRRGKTMLEH